MQSLGVLRVLGVLLVMFSTTLLPPILIALIGKDGGLQPFLIAYVTTLLLGGALWAPLRHQRRELRVRDGFLIAYVATLLVGGGRWIPLRNQHRELRVRDGFLIVVLFWTVLALFGAFPLLLSADLEISITDALFESMSGLTTTGATVLTGLDALPASILYYRQQLQWLGGMGIIVLAVAVMPMLGVGGMQLYRAETPGPMKDNKLTPRITETAKAL